MRRDVHFWIFVTLTAAYVALALLLPPDPKVLAQHNITNSQAHVINASIVIPISLIYLSALYGYQRFKAYSQTISKTKEGEAFEKLSIGLMVLAFGLPFQAVATTLLNYLAQKDPSLLTSVVILRNYIALIFPLIAFLYINQGAQELFKTLKDKATLLSPKYNLVGVIALTSFFTWIITTRTDANATYYLPNWLIIATIGIPYVFIWCKGVIAADYLFVYARNVKGTVYKYAIVNLARGVSAIILVSILIRMIATISGRLNRLDLQPLLIFLYILIAFYAVGFGLVARGAKKLKQIEEV